MSASRILRMFLLYITSMAFLSSSALADPYFGLYECPVTGYVGIGTDTPDKALTVLGSMQVENETGNMVELTPNDLLFKRTTGPSYIHQAGGKDLYIKVGGLKAIKFFAYDQSIETYSDLSVPGYLDVGSENEGNIRLLNSELQNCAQLGTDSSGDFQCESSAKRHFVSVKDYGAVGDGSTNDIAAIDSAIVAVYNAGGGTVFFPAGTYLVDEGVAVLTGVEIKGAGRDLTTVKLVNGSGHSIASFYQAHDVAIRNMTLEMVAYAGVHGIRVESTENAVVEGVKIKDPSGYGIGLQVGVLKNIYINDVILTGHLADGIDFKNVSGENANISLSNIRVEDVPESKAGIDIRGRVNLSNIYVYVNHNSSVGVRFRQSAGGTAGIGGHKSTLSNFRIEGNSASGSTGVGIYANNVSVSNGTIDGSYFGIEVDDPDSSGAVHNTNITGVNIANVHTGYYLLTPKINVSNAFIENPFTGVYVQTSATGNIGVNLTNITVDASRGYGYLISDTNNNKGAGTDGVRLTNCKAQNAQGSTGVGFHTNADHTVFIGCSAIGNIDQGITLANASGMVPDSCIIKNSEFSNNGYYDIGNAGTGSIIADNIHY